MNLDLTDFHERFYLVYQPIMNSRSQIVKCEVLLRWDRGYIDCTPQQLIEWAEQDKEAIVQIDIMVLEKLINDISTLITEGYQFFPMRFAVNVSPTTLGLDSRYLRHAGQIVTQIPDGLLEMEVLESKVHESYRPRIKLALKQLDKMGIFLSIDDFGAGFDSILKMTEMGYKNIKIDGELVTGVHSCKATCQVVSSLIDLAHKLGKTVTAEKIEHPEQFDALKQIGCDYYQGYYFSKPVLLNEFLSLLNIIIEMFGRLFVAVKDRDVKLIIRSLQQMSGEFAVKDMRHLEYTINEFVQSYNAVSIHSNEMSHVLLELRDIIVDHGLSFPSHFFLLARSMVTLEGVVHSMDDGAGPPLYASNRCA